MQSVQPIFSFFGFWGEGEREKFFLFSIGGGGPIIHPWNGGDNHVAIYLIIRRQLLGGTDPRLSLAVLFFTLFF
jgi:hypothetical protein